MEVLTQQLQKERFAYVAGHDRPAISMLRGVLNILGCVIVSYVHISVFLFARMPLTLDTFFTILLAEYNRYANETRRDTLTSENHKNDFDALEKGNLKKVTDSTAEPSCIASIIGYREDPVVFTKALESYKVAEKCDFILVGVDGNGPDDQEMVQVFRKVYPDGAIVSLSEPLADQAMRLYDKLHKIGSDEKSGNTDDPDMLVVSACCRIARGILKENDINLTGDKAVTQMCLSQPHMHKKGIMFTAFIFSIVICEVLGIEFIWSSDSDSWITPDAIRRTVSTVVCDPNTAGASTALSIHNADENAVTQLANAVYLSELYLARSMAGARAVNECQSGPCAMFRATVLSRELLGWYNQKVMGHWMIVNEDRHLTTRLLLAGWKVTFVSDVVTATDTPNTLRRWVLQQIRWGRATIIESLYQPQLTLIQSPLLFLLVLRRVITTVLVPLCIVIYLLSGKVIRKFEYSDIIQRAFWSLLYIAIRNPYRGNLQVWYWVVPAQLFYNLPMPAIQFCSLVTMLSDKWEPPAASDKVRHHRFRVRLREMGIFILWMGLSGGASARFLGTAMHFPSDLLRNFTIAAMFVFWMIVGGWAILAEQ